MHANQSNSMGSEAMDSRSAFEAIAVSEPSGPIATSCPTPYNDAFSSVGEARSVIGQIQRRSKHKKGKSYPSSHTNALAAQSISL
jgi:hypothetical protein